MDKLKNKTPRGVKDASLKQSQSVQFPMTLLEKDEITKQINGGLAENKD